MYNAEKRVVVLESNATLLNELKGAIERQGNFIVAYTGDDGENGVKQIVNSKPDIVIVGTFLKGLDGCNVIREIKSRRVAEQNYRDGRFRRSGYRTRDTRRRGLLSD